MSKYCPSCSRIVYHAEQVNAGGGVYHTACFVCSNPECGRRLDSRSCNQHEGKLWCNFCYKDLFGPSGIGFGGLCIRKHLDTEQPRPVNGAEKVERFVNTQKDINSVKFYGNSINCHQYQQTSSRQQQPNQAILYTPVFRTWYH